MRNILLVSIFGTLLGYIAMYTGEIESGLAICSAVLTGFFGYSKYTKKEQNTKQTFLVLFVLGLSLLVCVFTFISNQISREFLIAVISVSMSAITGYLAFCQQLVNREEKDGL
jgi:FtsH-binding integral membrane protein